MPVRPRQHQLEDESIDFVKSIIPKQWVVRELDRDYGIDLLIEIFENDTKTGRNFATGKMVFMQLKATDHLGFLLAGAQHDRGKYDHGQQCSDSLGYHLFLLAFGEKSWVPTSSQLSVSVARFTSFVLL